MASILGDLRDLGFSGFLSLELFNREYWKRDASEVAKEGLASMRAAVASARA
jgi:sugar phosphate isomerase/epimerase